jgi:proline iminopeptidase
VQEERKLLTIQLQSQDYHATTSARNIKWSRLKRQGSFLVLIVAVVLGWISGAGVFVAAAYLTDEIPILVVAGIVELLLVTFWGVRRASRGVFPNTPLQQQRVTVIVCAASLFLFILLGALFVFRPMSITYYQKEVTDNLRYWELPATGSRLAYVLTPGQGKRQPYPVLMLHGGPGSPGRFDPSPEVQRLAEEGFDVYKYDQVGSGLSNRLEDVREYTVGRHVADLEAIRQTIGAERLILIGGSWGGTLAAHYLAAYPNRVERVVFSSPGAIWEPGFGNQETTDGSDNAAITENATPRFMMVMALLQANGQAAQNFASDEEMSAYFQQLVGQVAASDLAGCERQAEPHRILYGFGFYANMMTTLSMNRTPDPRPHLRSLNLPVLILRGECDRMRPEVAQEYDDIFSNSTFLTVQGAGHAVFASPHYVNIISEFVMGTH